MRFAHKRPSLTRKVYRKSSSSAKSLSTALFSPKKRKYSLNFSSKSPLFFRLKVRFFNLRQSKIGFLIRDQTDSLPQKKRKIRKCIFPYKPSIYRVFGGSFQNAESVSLLFEFFEEVLPDNLPQEQVLLGADDGAVLFRLAAGHLRRKKYVRTKNFYEMSVPSCINVPEDFRSQFRMSRHCNIRFRLTTRCLTIPAIEEDHMSS